MAISEALLPEFDHEMANTRKTLERVPDDKLDYKPHEKSMSMRKLGTHIADIPRWVVFTIQDESFDVSPPGGEPMKEDLVSSAAALLERFDKNVANAREALAGARDEDLLVPWSLLAAGNAIFTMPRIGVLRSMILNHTIHHRAQLGVYLRLNDLPVPSVYGPSADEE